MRRRARPSGPRENRHFRRRLSKTAGASSSCIIAGRSKGARERIPKQFFRSGRGLTDYLSWPSMWGGPIFLACCVHLPNMRTRTQPSPRRNGRSARGPSPIAPGAAGANEALRAKRSGHLRNAVCARSKWIGASCSRYCPRLHNIWRGAAASTCPRRKLTAARVMPPHHAWNRDPAAAFTLRLCRLPGPIPCSRLVDITPVAGSPTCSTDAG